MIAYQDFARLLLDVGEFETMDDYVADCGGSVDGQDVALLPVIWRMGRGGVKAIRAESGLSQKDFARAYGVPRRTLQNWELPEESPEHRECPAYMARLMGYAVLSDREAAGDETD